MECTDTFLKFVMTIVTDTALEGAYIIYQEL